MPCIRDSDPKYGSSLGAPNNSSEVESYDVPSQFASKVSLEQEQEPVLRDLSTTTSSHLHKEQPFVNTTTSSRSSSSSISHDMRPPGNRSAVDDANHGDVKIMPLGSKAAVTICEKLRQEVVSSISAILSHVKPRWRTKTNLTEVMPDLKFACTRLCLAIKDVADFATRSLSNAKRLHDDSIHLKLHRVITPVINGSQIIQRDVDELDAYFWSADRLSVTGGDVASSTSFSNLDALDQLILCCRSLKHDVSELANFLALHSTTLYSESQQLDKPVTDLTKVAKSGGTQVLSGPMEAETSVEFGEEDYDYVSLMTDRTSKDNSREGTGSQSPDSQITLPSSTSTVSWQLDTKDEQLLEFYSAQISVSAPQLSQAIATFISAIQQNEPPTVFNVHLKYVILLGYKLLFAGDTVHRNIHNTFLRVEVELRANDLHKSILALYESSKVATVEFPKVGPMQTVVDKVWETTQAATQLKKCIVNATFTSSV